MLLAQNESVSLKLEYTDNEPGYDLKLIVDNSTDALYYQNINPFLLNTGKNNQALLIPFGQVIHVKSGEKKIFYLKSYTVFPDRPAQPDINYELSPDIIENAMKKEQGSFEQTYGDSTSYIIRRMKLSELIPFDYILTFPGTFEMLQFTFDAEQNHDLATSLLVEQAQRIMKGYDRLYTAGSIVTNFNADPIFEKELFMQLSIWICGSGLEGKALKNSHIKKIISELYTKFARDGNSKEIDEHMGSYYKILERLGREAKVFSIPMDFDKRPQCLPAFVGLVPTSDHVKSPTILKNRFDKVPIRNQVMHKRNNCLPCILTDDLHASLKNYIYAFEVNHLIEEFNKLYGKLNNITDLSSDARTILNNAVAKLENLMNYDAAAWLKEYSIPQEERIDIAFGEYEQITSELIKTNSDVFQMDMVSALRSVVSKHKFLLQYIFDNYRFRDSRFSFDCCDMIHKPSTAETDLSIELADMALSGINRSGKLLFHILDEMDQANDLDDELVSKLISAGSELFALQVLLKAYRILLYNKQIICMEGPAPTSRIEALGRINSLLGTNIRQTGEYLHDNLYLQISENESLEFHFGDCKCGKERESNMPILPLQRNSLQVLNSVDKIPLRLTPLVEISAYYGRLYLFDQGSVHFNGGGLSFYDSINPQLDSTLKSRYSKFYKLNEPTDFNFNYFNHISIIAAADIHKNFQYRLGTSFYSGSARATLPLSYFEIQSDSTTLIIVDGLVYSKIKSWSVESGFRYYMGQQLKIFTGLNAQYMRFTNTESRTYIETIEIQNPLVEKKTFFSAFFEAGIRYYPNQDFFVELGGQVFNRWDEDKDDNQISSIDKSFRLGFGARF